MTSHRIGIGVSVGVAVAILAACGSNANHDKFGNGDDASDDGASNGDGFMPMFGDSGPMESGPPVDAGDGCPDSAKLIYITGVGAELWSFWPPTFTFKKIGVLSCTTFPTHMTVDRQGTAWVVADGNVYKTSTKDATCSLLSTWTQQNGFSDFALSFVGVTNGDTSLYVLGDTDLGLFDIVKGTFKTVGTPGVPDTFGDMTSNGDGTLYFLHDADPLNLYELSPTNAKVLKTYSPPVATGGGDQALAYFGARFYMFEDGVVYEFDPMANTTKTLGNAPLSVTGAGQSTCVPMMPTEAGPPN